MANATSNNLTFDETIHNCADLECSGIKCDGIKMSCAWCSQHTFLECLLDRPEIERLLQSIIPKKAPIEFLSSHWKIVQAAFEGIFQRKSVIDFVCLECQSTGSHRSIVADSEEAQIETRRQLASAKAQIVKLNMDKAAAIDTLTQQLNEANSKINDLQQTAANLNENHSDFINKKASIESVLSEMSTANKTLSDGFVQLSSVFNSIRVPDQSQSFPSQASTSQASKSHEMNASHGTDLLLPQNTSNLPATIANSSNDDENLSIYVSKFSPTETCDRIINYIVEATKLQRTDFSVTLMAGRRLLKWKQLSYVSFKITASNRKAYALLLSANIWAPHFTAEPFNTKLASDKEKKMPRNQRNHINLQPPSDASNNSNRNSQGNSGNSKSKQPKKSSAKQDKNPDKKPNDNSGNQQGDKTPPKPHKFGCGCYKCYKGFCAAQSFFSPYHQLMANLGQPIHQQQQQQQHQPPVVAQNVLQPQQQQHQQQQQQGLQNLQQYYPFMMPPFIHGQIQQLQPHQQ